MQKEKIIMYKISKGVVHKSVLLLLYVNVLSYAGLFTCASTVDNNESTYPPTPPLPGQTVVAPTDVFDTPTPPSEDNNEQQTTPSDNENGQQTAPSDDENDQQTAPSDDENTQPSDDKNDQQTAPSQDNSNQPTTQPENENDQQTPPSDNTDQPVAAPPRPDFDRIDENNSEQYQALYQDLQFTYDVIKRKLLTNYPEYSADNMTNPAPKGSIISNNNPYNRHIYGGLEVITDVYVRFNIERIVEMDMARQALTLVVFETFVWRDLSLTWNSSELFLPLEVNFMEISTSQIWIPNVVFANVLDDAQLGNDYAEVDFRGYVFMSRLKEYTMPCTLEIHSFPFDVHNCSLVLGQNTDGPARIQFRSFYDWENPGDIYTRGYYHHLEWNILNVINVTKPMRFSDHGGNYTEADKWDGYYYELTVTLQREGLFYAVTLIFPLVLLNLMSFVIFTLPTDNTERENFAMTLILTYYVLVLIIIDSSPPSGSQMPKLALYILLSTCVAVTTFVEALILIELHEHCRLKKQPMPRWLSRMLENCCNLEKYFHRKYAEIEKPEDIPDADVEEIPNGKMQKTNYDLTFEKFRHTKEYEVFKWRVFISQMNFVFCFVTFVAHVVIPICVYSLGNSAIRR